MRTAPQFKKATKFVKRFDLYPKFQTGQMDHVKVCSSARIKIIDVLGKSSKFYSNDDEGRAKLNKQEQYIVKLNFPQEELLK